MTDRIENVRVGVGPDGSPYARESGRGVDYTSGEYVTMSNGEIWFHPYNGTKPTRIKRKAG